ncbi:MAG: glycerol-3-phosphate dehydrogenase/oxidase [Bdellovibrionales bacterium]|nr:glycerol-3-phosphate dehydrogenase/oxidase [Bdellovibrionales bacterium]
MTLRQFSRRERSAQIEQLRASSPHFDVCIVGGGVTGAAIARDAALRGWKVLLLEKNDFASGTSSRSSKLVHGGVRYLEQYEFGLVRESTRERARLWKLAPQLVTPLAFLFPAYKDSRVPLWKLNLGLWLYDLLATLRTPTLHRRYGRQRTLQEEPGLRGENLNGSIFYWDALTDDGLITLANIKDAVAVGATALPRTAFKSIRWNKDVATNESAAHTVQAEDLLTGQSFEVKTRILLVAGGPWTDKVLTEAGHAPRKPLLAPTRGSHIVVTAERLPAKHAIVMTHPQDGRVLFVIPWGDHSIIGTTDLYDSGDPERTVCNREEVAYLLNSANHYFPKSQLRVEDVISTWSGLRPLLAPPDQASASDVSREHHIEWMTDGLLVIAGGKLTTHREMAEQAIERIYRETSHWTRVPGGAYAATETHRRPLPKLLNNRRDWRALCREEMVLSLEDLLVRRTQTFYKDSLNGWNLLPELKPILCEELGWDDTEWQRQVYAYRAYLMRNVYEPLGRAFPGSRT